MENAWTIPEAARWSIPNQVRTSWDRKVPYYLRIRDHFASLIETGALSPGMKLPPERMLGEKFRITRVTVRQALMQLEAEGNTIDQKRVLRTAGFVAALVPFSFLDEKVSEAARGWNRGLFGDFLDCANEAGSFKATLIPTGIFLVSLATDDAKFQDAAFTSLQAIIYTNVISFTVKSLIGRARPEDGKGAHHFAPFSEFDASFPSGHTATAFAILSPWVFYYPHALTYGLLVIGGGAALARLQRQKHWMTDVLAGGTLGLSMAYWLSRKHQGRLPNTSVAQKQQQKHSLTDVLAGVTLGLTMAYWPSLKHQGRRSNMSVVPTVGLGSVGLTMQMTF